MNAKKNSMYFCIVVIFLVGKSNIGKRAYVFSMGKEKIVSYKDIGEVSYRKNPRAKNLAIRINRDREVRITVPGWCSFIKAEGFVLEKRDWIVRKKAEMEQKSGALKSWQDGDVIPMVSGSVFLRKSDSVKYHVQKGEGSYLLEYPWSVDEDSLQHKEKIKDIIGWIGVQEAKVQLPDYLRHVSEAYGLPFGKVTVRRNRSRWGSCSAQDNISLSSGLIFLPERLIKYVCLHELVHTKHKNHSKAFWDALVEILPDALERRKELRSCSIMA